MAGRPKCLAFYDLPEHRTNSHKVITEARTAVNSSSLTGGSPSGARRRQPRAVDTARPQTPAESRRQLLRRSSVDCRTSSSLSFDSHEYEGIDSRPTSGTRLLPLNHHPVPSESKLASNPKTSESNKKNTPRANSLHNVRSEQNMAPSPPLTPRRVTSGPTQHRHQRMTSRPCSGASSAGEPEIDKTSATGDRDFTEKIAEKNSPYNDESLGGSETTDNCQAKVALPVGNDQSRPANSRASSKNSPLNRSPSSKQRDREKSQVLNTSKSVNNTKLKSKDKNATKSNDFSNPRVPKSDLADKDDPFRDSIGSSTSSKLHSDETAVSISSSRCFDQSCDTWDTTDTSFDQSGSSAFDTSATRSTANESNNSVDSPMSENKKSSHIVSRKRENLQKNTSASTEKKTFSTEKVNSSRTHSGKKKVDESKVEKITQDMTNMKTSCNKNSLRAKNTVVATTDIERDNKTHKEDRMGSELVSAENRSCNGNSSHTSLRDGDEITPKSDNRMNNKSVGNHDSEIVSIIKHLRTFKKSNDKANSGEIYARCDRLYHLLKVTGQLRKTGEKRTQVLGTLFSLLTSAESDALVNMSRIILAYDVKGRNLENVYKILVKVARYDNNDVLFLKDNIIELLLSVVNANRDTDDDALFYGLAAVKTLSSSCQLIAKLVEEKTVFCLVTVLRSLHKKIEYIKDPKHLTKMSKSIILLTGTLRNLSDDPNTYKDVVAADLTPDLLTSALLFPNNTELCLNIIRIFSKLSLNDCCCQELIKTDKSLEAFIGFINDHIECQDLVVRTCFIMGNLSAYSDSYKLKFFSFDGALESLIKTLFTYAEADQSKQTTIREDVIVKVVRIIANLALEEDVGYALSRDQRVIDALLYVLEHNENAVEDDLISHTLTTLSNLTFYWPINGEAEGELNVAKALLPFMSISQVNYFIEATSVYGNLSRSYNVREFITNNRIDEFMVLMLDSGNVELVFTACGVLINLMLDIKRRESLKKFHGISKLIEVINTWSVKDWDVASMACKVLYNFSADITSCRQCFGDESAQILASLLYEKLDSVDDSDFEEGDDDTDEMKEKMKDEALKPPHFEFIPVARALLERVVNHTSEFDSLTDEEYEQTHND